MMDTLGPFHSQNLMSPYDVANALNQLNNQIGTGSGASVSSANFVDTLALAKTTRFLAIIDGGPEWVVTQGYNTIGDKGGMTSKRISSMPAVTAGTWTSADGQLWQYVMTGSEIHVNAFGALSTSNTSDYSRDNLSALNDCRDFILSQASATQGPGCTMKLSDGMYYSSKSFVTGCGNYNIEGHASRITTPWPYDQIIVIQSGLFGREGAAYSTAFPVYLGQRVSVGNHIYVCITAGTPSGSTPPSGTSAGQVDGTAVWNYEREKTYAEQQPGNFNGHIKGIVAASNWSNGAPHTTGIEATHPSDDQTNLATEGAYFAGFLCRSRCMLEDVACFGQPGMGIAFVGDGDPYIRGPANVNNWYVNRATTGFLAWNGLHLGLADANAGVAIDIDTAFCGGFGIANFAFLDNKFLGTQHVADGTYGAGYSKYPTAACHRGYQYRSRLPLGGAEAQPLYLNEEPGAAPVSSRSPWIRWDGNGTFQYATLTASISGTTLTVTAASGSALNVGSVIYDGGVTAGTKITDLGTGTGGNGTYIVSISQARGSTTMHADTVGDANYAPWSPTQKYMPGGCYGNNNINNRGVIVGMYLELGVSPAQFGADDIVIGSLLQGLYDTSRGGSVDDAGQWNGQLKTAGLYTSNAGRKERTIRLGAIPTDGGLNTQADGTILDMTDYDGQGYNFGSLREDAGGAVDRTVNNDFDWGVPNQAKWLKLSGWNTLRAYGAPSPIPMATQIPNLIVGNQGGDGRLVFMVPNGPPGSTAYARGTVAIEMNATAGAASSWQLTPTGWKAMTTLAP